MVAMPRTRSFGQDRVKVVGRERGRGGLYLSTWLRTADWLSCRAGGTRGSMAGPPCRGGVEGAEVAPSINRSDRYDQQAED